METAAVKWIGEEKFVATSPSGHAMAMDSDRESNKAPGPMELLLMALGACTATDVVAVVKEKRGRVGTLGGVCLGGGGAGPPTVWTELGIGYALRGPPDGGAGEHANELSEEKYCSVAAMLKKTAKVTWRYEILRGEA